MPKMKNFEGQLVPQCMQSHMQMIESNQQISNWNDWRLEKHSEVSDIVGFIAYFGPTISTILHPNQQIHRL